MAIYALPQNTIHLLGSSQALTTPTSLVKELIDNSLDAKATSVDILISPNTIDKIEVRDNGHGIPQEDLDALGRRGHTSKLRSFDELKSIGGVSLGFRGEALASAVQLGEVSVTTKTEGEAVATTVKLKAPGGIAQQTRTSHPVGTTVCVLNFMSKLPVRKQTALKDAVKTQAKIKELLQSYSLARPHIRFSLKVAKGGKGSWSFAPRPNDGIKEAVSQVIGRDAATECMEKTLMFAERGGEDAAVVGIELDISESLRKDYGSGNNQFVVELFLPKPDADPSKISHGQYISIDSRPVSHEKGTMRRIVTLFKCYVKGSLQDQAERLKNPFLRLNIKCPMGSYDPNVEPAKDDVLFGSEYLVLESLEQLFKEIYGDQKVASEGITRKKSGTTANSFDLLLARKPITTHEEIESPSPETSSAPAFSPLVSISVGSKASSVTMPGHISPVEESETAQGAPVGTKGRKWGFDMSKDYSEEVGGTQKQDNSKPVRARSPTPDSDEQRGFHDALNPWIIAKLNAPVRDIAPDSTTTPKRMDTLPPSTPHFLPRPQYPSNISVVNHETTVVPPAHLQETGPFDGIHALANADFPVFSPLNQRTPPHPHSHRRSMTAERDDETLLVGDDSETFRRRKQGNDFISGRQINDNLIESLPKPPRSAPRKATGINKPFVPPKPRMDGLAQGHNFRQMRILDFHPPRARSLDPQTRPQQDLNLDLSWAMDFENRKEEASRRNREERRAARREQASMESEGVPWSSPHKNRYNAAIAALEADHSITREPELQVDQSSFRKPETVTKEPFKTTIPDGDPRAYLMKRQKSTTGKPGAFRKMSRAKTMRLPLETTSENEKLHMLVLTVSTTFESLRKGTRDMAKFDTYVTCGNQDDGLEMSGYENATVVDKLKAVVGKWAQTEARNDCEVEYNLENLMRGSS